jgi:hypothetical protein
MKVICRTFWLSLFFTALLTAVVREGLPADEESKKWEIGLFGGIGIIARYPPYGPHYWRLLNGNCTQDGNLYGYIVISSDIFFEEYSAGTHFGVQCSYFFSREFGIQTRIGRFNATIDSTSYISVTMESKPNDYASRVTWDFWERGNGRLGLFYISLNLIRRIEVVKNLEFLISAGPTIWFNSFRASASVGVIETEDGNPLDFQSTRIVDCFIAPLKIEKASWVVPGLNMGVGFRFLLSKSFSIDYDFRYLYGREKVLGWTWEAGTFVGQLGNLGSRSFSQDRLEYLQPADGPQLLRLDILHVYHSLGLSFRF